MRLSNFSILQFFTAPVAPRLKSWAGRRATRPVNQPTISIVERSGSRIFSHGLFLVSLFFWCESVPAQSGCTDPQALNFDASASENDGSCQYASTTYPPHQIAVLPAALSECSGLIYFADRLWAHEDGGNSDKFFVVDTLTGEILSEINPASTENIDWEDFAQNDAYLFVGDFGNNEGSRTDLRILRYSKSAILAGAATPDEIGFSFSDQTDFTPAYHANNFDCEAFFFWNDSLHLFSKNWLDFKTRHYVLPATPGNHVASLRDSLNVQGQITGSDITADGKAALLGYNVNTGAVFFWLLFDFPGSHFFEGNKRKISLGSALTTSQAEGIAFRNNSYGYIGSEDYSALPARLMSFSIGQWMEPPNAVAEVEPLVGMTVFPNPFSGSFFVEFREGFPEGTTLQLTDFSGKIWLEKKLPALSAGQKFLFDCDGLNLPSGEYLLVARRQDEALFSVRLSGF